MGYDLDSGIQEISSTFEMSQAEHYVNLYSGHERHGVWEWRVLKPGRRLRRYVILTVSNLEDENSPRDMQFYAGADDDRAFTKRLVIRSRVAPVEVIEFVWRHLRDAYQAADALTEDNLDTLYNQRRYASPDEASSPVNWEGRGR